MKLIGIALSSAVLLCALNCETIWAQATAQISGTVRDQTGAVLPGAEITGTQTDTGITRSTVSDESGFFLLPNLATGPYRLDAALPGFRTYVQSGIVLQVNANVVINAVLQVGQVTDQVEVQANAAMVETRAVGIGQVIENTRILELPLNGRQVTDLITLAGGAVQTQTATPRSMQGGVGVSVGGGLDFGTAYVLDGALHNNPVDNYNLPMPFPDALQEFKVETSGLSAEHGMHSGAAVSAVTKSGTNDFHGDGFEFVRNDLFNARNYFATKNSTLKRNQFGGTVGGPVLRNKLFFFGGYQGTTIRQDPANIESFVPTAAMLAGDFTAFASPACNAGRQIALRGPFVNNRIDPALYSRAALNIAGKLPKSLDPACGRFVSGQRNVENDHQGVGKIDYQWSSKQSVFGRYMATHVGVPVPYSFTQDNLLTVSAPGYDNLAQAFTFGDTYLFGPNTVNSFRLAVNRTAVRRNVAQFFSPEDIGIPVYSYPTAGKYTALTVTGNFMLGFSTTNASKGRATSYQVSDDVHLVRGRHEMSLGANLAYWMYNFVGNTRSTPNFTFNGQTTGLAMADFLLGQFSQFDQSTPNAMYMGQWYVGLYAQDAWRVTPRLTLNYGLRWEPYFPQSARNGAIYNVSYDRFRQGIKSTVFKSAPAGIYFPGDPGYPSGKSGSYKQWWQLGPRLGLAWDPEGNGRTSIRASYGLAYDFQTAEFNLGTSGNAPPWNSRVQLVSGSMDNPWSGFPGGNPFPSPPVGPNVSFTPRGVFLSTPYDLATPYNQTWNLAVQRELATNWLLSANYLGGHIINTRTTKPQNNAVYFPGVADANGQCFAQGYTLAAAPGSTCSSSGNTEARRRFTLERPQDGQYISFADEFDGGGTQSYHALLLSVQRRAAKGVTVSGNYTLSHCIGDILLTSASNAGANAYQDPNNRRTDRGNCSWDRRHIFNLTGVASTPTFATPTLRMLASGWTLSGIYRRSSGTLLTLTNGVDRSLSGTMNQRPNQVLLNAYSNTSAAPLSSFINPAAFALPAVGTLGNVGAFTIQGPPIWQFDLSLSRAFNVRESQRVEARFEAYNVTNSFRPQNPSAVVSQNTFGQIRQSYDPRIMQFALKYVF